MLGLLLALPAAFIVFGQRRGALLLCFLLPVFAISNLPSELKRYFVSQVGGVNVFPQDLLLLIALIGIAINRDVRRSATSDRALLVLVIAYILYHLLSFYVFSATGGFELNHLRMTLFGALWMPLALYDFRAVDRKHTHWLGFSFTAHNCIVALGAVALLAIPGVNKLDSPFASYVGFSADGFEGTSLILVSALSGSLAVVSLWYYLFVEKRSVFALPVVLAVVVVIATSHRIDYVALGLVLLAALASGTFFTGLVRRPVRNLLLFCGYTGTLIWAFATVGLSFTDIADPFIERAGTLLSGGQYETVSERYEQYQYFLTGYVSGHDFARYLFGEGYLPTHVRDTYYQSVQPHNFLFFTFVNNGIVGVILLACIGVYVAVIRGGWRSAAFLPLVLLLVTQLTDAGFTHYPVSAYFAIFLALCRFSSFYQPSWVLSPVSPVAQPAAESDPLAHGQRNHPGLWQNRDSNGTATMGDRVS